MKKNIIRIGILAAGFLSYSSMPVIAAVSGNASDVAAQATINANVGSTVKSAVTTNVGTTRAGSSRDTTGTGSFGGGDDSRKKKNNGN
ncbi:MAG: hypothetical protein NT163_07545 [Chlorobiales bacterium]|nr:hypothetical protein [Chlorobiales bacterium]